MNNQVFNFLTPSNNDFVPSVITTLQSITRYDMIYIYHHLSLGTKVELRKTNVQGNYSVYFKTYKLGYVQFKKWIFGSEKKVLSGSIKYIEHTKYMPITGMDIEISSHDFVTF